MILRFIYENSYGLVLIGKYCKYDILFVQFELIMYGTVELIINLGTSAYFKLTL